MVIESESYIPDGQADRQTNITDRYALPWPLKWSATGHSATSMDSDANFAVSSPSIVIERNSVFRATTEGFTY